MTRPSFPSSGSRIRFKSSHRRLALKTSHRRLGGGKEGVAREEEREGYIAPPRKFRR